MTKKKEETKVKKDKTSRPLIKYETVNVDGVAKTKITYADGRIEYREL